MKNLTDYITPISDFPKPGILFRDISPLLKLKFTEAIDLMSGLFSKVEWENIDMIAGIESRGFIFASALAYKHSKGFLQIRKSGKLPQVVGKISYSLEYGESSLEMQRGTHEKILIVDDLMATGGSMRAAADLAQQVGYQVMGLTTLINLSSLNSFNWREMNCRSAISFQS